MPQDIMSLDIDENKVTFVKGMRVDFMVILSFGVFFSYFNGFQCNTVIFIGALKHDEYLF